MRRRSSQARDTWRRGDGSQTRDFVFVADVVQGLLAAASAPAAGVYNIGTGVGSSVLELHQVCARAAGVELQPRFAPERPGDLRRSILDVSLAEEALGWRAETRLEDGVARTWDVVSCEGPARAGPSQYS